MNDELCHYGVKGMKWGIRRKRKTRNENYSDKQRKNDRALYGDRSEKRINKKLNEGYGLRGARHFEVERKERKEKTKRVAKKGARAAAKAVATIGSYALTDEIFFGGAGRKAAGRAAKTVGRAAASAVLRARGADYVRWYN